MRLPCCSISLWGDLIRKTSLPQWVRQSGTKPSPQHQNNLPPHTLNLRSVFEIICEAAAHNFGEQVEEMCLADSRGPGLGSVRQSLWPASVQNRMRELTSGAPGGRAPYHFSVF